TFIIMIAFARSLRLYA
ncbi:hypothetical protein, partial [Escherichia coli]